MRRSLSDYCSENGMQELLTQWNGPANLPQTPETVSYGSKYKAHWRCAEGHEWQATVYSRTGSRSGCPVCAGLTVVAGENDLQTLFPAVAREWHPTKNAALTPENVGAYTHRKAWWLCDVCGHEWSAEIKSRTSGCGCPVCAGRMVLRGVNDLASRFPELAAEWSAEKNGAFRAEDVLPGSQKRVWWRCAKCGYEYQAGIASRTGSQSGCPVCAGRTALRGVNDLASKYPQLAREWHPTKNGTLTPENVTPHSSRTVWWRCGRGHDFAAQVSCRTGRQEGCPYCGGQRVLAGFNDLATLAPEVAAQWHPTKNEALTPQQVTCGSKKKVWWLCNVCGHEWKANIYSRAGAQRCGCPLCAGRIRIRSGARYGRVLPGVNDNSTGLP